MENTKKALPGPIVFEGRTLNVKQSQTVLERLQDEGLDVDSSCGGNATCGTCRVIVESPLENLPERNEVEAEFAEARGFEPAERLACQLECQAGLSLSRPHFFCTKNGLE